MSGVECVRCLRDDVQHAIRPQSCLPPQDGGERFTLDQLHHQEGGPVRFAVVVHTCDAVMVHPRRVPAFGAETLQETGRVDELGLEDLDRNGAADDPVRCLPHLTHAADRDPT